MVVEETLLILQESQYYSLLELVDAVPRWMCEGVCDIVGVEARLGGVAQVIFHGVQVVEVGVQVRVHQDRGEEEDGEGQVEVEREVGEDQGETHMCDMQMTRDERLNQLEPRRS